MYGFSEMEDFLIKNNNISFGLVSPSVWAQRHVSYVYDKDSRLHQVCRLVHSTVIANPLSVELFEEIEAETEYITKKPRSSIFHSQYNRGGAITEKVIQELSWPNTEFLCYLGGEGLGRKQLYKKLLETEYFIFPIYNHTNKMLLKDTFCCAVAEAMAAGVITITYPVGGIKEHFGDGCIFVNFPPNTDIESMHRDWATMDAEYMEYTENIKNTLLLIENNPTLKNNIRQNAMRISRSRLNIPRIGKEWENFIHILTERGGGHP